MKQSIFKALGTVSVLPLCILSATPAVAQENADTSKANESSMIVVTARKVEENLQDIPGAITAFTSEEMTRRSISELEDIALQTPGLVFEDFSNGGFGAPSIRGTTQLTITALEQNVSVFLDGIYIPRQYAFDIGSLNLERIEVVKGPQSSLYGANAFAGAINYISSGRSLSEFSASGQIEVSENSGFDISGKINAPLVPDILSVRLALGYSEFDGDWENNHPDADLDISPGTTGKIGGYEKTSVLVGASLKPIDALRLDFDYYKFDTSSETRAQHRITRGNGDLNCSSSLIFGQPVNQLFCGALPVEPIPGPSGNEGVTIDPRTYGLESETDIVRVGAELDITDQISAAYQYGHIEGEVFSAGQSGRDALTPDFNFFTGTIGNNFAYVPSGSFNYDSHELRLQYQGDSGLYLMVGGFIQDGKDLEQTAFGIVPFRGTDPVTSIPAGTNQSDAITETRINAIFGRISVPFLDERLTFEAEGRYSKEEKDVLDVTSGVLFPYRDNYFTPRVSLDYKITDDNLIYASVAKGVKSGGVNTSTFAGLIDDERVYGPDTNWTYEIGLKNSFMGGRGTLNAALFQINWGNLQLPTTPTGAPINTTTITTNLGGAKSKGIELEGMFEIVEGITINGGLAYIDAKYDEGTISARITRSGLCDDIICPADGNIGGNEMQRNSKWQWNAGIAFDGPLTGDLDYFSRIDVAGQSKQYATEINVTTIEPRALVNGRLGVRAANWSASIWAKNLFDKEYVSNAFFIANPFQVDYVPTLGNRRRIGATLSFNY